MNNITDEQIIALHNTCNDMGKDFLLELFPKTFEKSLLTRAIEYLGEEDEEVKALRQIESLSFIDHLIAEQKLIVIYRFLNEKHEFNWSDSNEYKWVIWLRLGNVPRLDLAVNQGSFSDASARLCLKSEGLCNKVINDAECIELFKKYVVK